ncbi:hypothetical protein Tco_0399885 [Tanacetum coccineum]
MVFYNEDGNPARANIKQALGRYHLLGKLWDALTGTYYILLITNILFDHALFIVVAEKGDKCEEIEAEKEKKGCEEEMSINAMDKKARSPYVFHGDKKRTSVILNGDGPIQVTTDENGVETEVPPKTAQALLQRQRERKAKSILLLAILDEYQLTVPWNKGCKVFVGCYQE